MRQDAVGLGDLEVLLLLAVLHLTEKDADAYGSAIRSEIEARTNQPVARGSIYVCLARLEAKGLLTSRTGPAAENRGGRPKRLFHVTSAGVDAVRISVSAVVRMQRGLRTVLGRV